MNININITAAKKPPDIKLEHKGLDDRYISGKDRRTFQLCKRRVMKAVNKLKKAEEQATSIMPIRAISTCHTPIGSLFARIGWRDITRMLKPVRWEIIRTHTERSIVAHKIFTNNTDQTDTFSDVLLFKNHHTVTTTKQVRFNSPNKYMVTLPVEDLASGESTTTKCFGTREEDYHEDIPYECRYLAKVVLEPGAVRVADLYVTHCINVLRVSYEASLLGELDCRFVSFLRWYRTNYPVNNVLQAAGLPPIVTVREDIEISFYTDEEVVIVEQ